MKRTHSHMGAKSIDEYAYLSKLKHINGKIKLGFAILVIVIVTSSNGWLVPVVATVMCCMVTIVFGGIRFRDYVSLFTVPLVFLVMGSLAIAMSIDLSAGFSIAFHHSDVVRALLVSVKALGAVSAMYTLSLSTPLDEIVTILSSLRLPDTICELMRLMYRYIFILADSQAKLQNAAASRLGYDGYVRSLKTFGLVCSNVLIVSLRRASDYYNAIESRSFGGQLKFLSKHKPIRLVHVLTFGGGVVLLLCLEILSRTLTL